MCVDELFVMDWRFNAAMILALALEQKISILMMRICILQFPTSLVRNVIQGLFPPAGSSTYVETYATVDQDL